MKKQRIIGITSALTASALLVGCAGGTSTTGGDEIESITIVHAPINYEVAYIAEREGYFEDLGLDVTIQPGGSPQDNLAQVVGGSAQLTIVSWDVLVTATAEGMPVVGVASSGVVSETLDTGGLIVRADSEIESIDDLPGATVAFNDLGGGPHVVTQQAFLESGLDPTDLDAVRIPFASMQASLENGQIDVAYAADSFYSQMSTNPDFKVISNPTREFRPGLPITLWAGTEQWLAENPETADKFIEAMELATAFYEDEANHETIIEIRQDVSGISAEEAELMETEFSVAIPLGVTQSVTDALVELGAVENVDGVKTSEELIWENSPTVE